jgi:hypothetical protein
VLDNIAPDNTAPDNSGWEPVDLRRIRVGFGDAGQLYFHLRPVWVGWDRAFAGWIAAHLGTGPGRLDMTAGPDEYVLTWPDAPQDIGTAIEAVDDLVADVNEAYLRNREAADASR